MKTPILPFLILIASSLSAASYQENLHPDWEQSFTVEEVLYEEKTDYQDMIIFKNATFGTVLALDGAIQLTENDEFIYSEMMAHVPLLAHGNAKNVLIIGGGDGGILREVLRHKTVEKVFLVEIDPEVISFSKKHLAFTNQGAFEDPRVQIIIEDGSKFVKETQESFDAIICDSTDPTGPAAVLFSKDFYRDCHNALTSKGIFVNQNGVPFLQPKEIPYTYQNRKESFKNVSFYVAAVPTYVGGFMALGWASDDPSYYEVSVEELTKRLEQVRGPMQYYTPSLHKASFALPVYIQKLIEEK